LDQQTATAEVLQVINSSPGNLAPVFDTMLEKATRLSDAAFGVMQVYDGAQFRTVATRSMPPALAEFLLHTPRQPTPHSAVSRILEREDFVHFEDMTCEPAFLSGDPRQQAFVKLGGTRTYVAVALRKDDRLLGTIATYRQEVRPFSEKQIALLQNFAAQAVIAMENARLITETREALEQQTATAEVLQVINSSPGDLTPVFNAMLERATTLCESAHGALFIRDGEGDHFRTIPSHSTPKAFAEFLTREPIYFDPERSILAQTLRQRSAIQIADMRLSEPYRYKFPLALAAVESGGTRTLLSVPLVRDDAPVGIFQLARQEVRPFSDKQIALVSNFAAQAVIAMENARLIIETREALDQQTATAEVLQVINSSPGDLPPVFESILEKAHTLCGATKGSLVTVDGEHFRTVAARGLSEQYAAILREAQHNAPGSVPDRLLKGESLVHLSDARHSGFPIPRAAAEIEGVRTIVYVPLRKDSALLGYITAYRQDVRPFTDKQIALLQNFAAQAVIAMENARLITETREALDQQTATAEILQVINSSPGDLAPVFDAMLEKATRFCEGTQGILWTYDGERFHSVAMYGVAAEFAAFLEQGVRPGPRAPIMRILRGERLVEIIDLAADQSYQAGEPLPRAAVEMGGFRSMIFVALVKDESLLGAFAIARQEVRAFTEKQIALAENFAAQAVIAMENARLLDEIRQRQAELRVTFDNMADGVAMFDGDRRLAAWNRNFQELLDLPDALLADRPSYADYLRILAERGEFGSDDIEAELSRRLEHTDQELRLERTRPDGRVIEVRRNAVEGGGFVLIYSDITERKRSEAEIRAARDAAEAAYRDLKSAQANLIQAEKMASLGQLTAGIAHEIKNPLNFVNNFAGLSVELLDELKETAGPAITALDDEKRGEIDETIEMLTGNLEKIAEHGRRADNIVKSMLEHSRGSSGERRSVDLNSLIEEALNLAYHGARAQDQSFNITLERDYAPVMAPIELVPQDITRVCLNLFGNGFYAATKRQKEGNDPKFKPTMMVSTRDLGNGVEIRVRDNGIGIPPEIKDKLFQPFFTTKPTGEGTGLGLSISYDIVTQQHGGTIEVDSRVGEFTEFTVRLPRKATMAEAAS
jgi:signal transduction histidine kinase